MHRKMSVPNVCPHTSSCRCLTADKRASSYQKTKANRGKRILKEIIGLAQNKFGSISSISKGKNPIGNAQAWMKPTTIVELPQGRKTKETRSRKRQQKERLSMRTAHLPKGNALKKTAKTNRGDQFKNCLLCSPITFRPAANSALGRAKTHSIHR